MRAVVHPEAWAYLVTHYLRPCHPPFAVSYRAMVRAADEYGWSPVPSLQAMQRRLDAQIPKSAQIAARSGKHRRISA